MNIAELALKASGTAAEEAITGLITTAVHPIQENLAALTNDVAAARAAATTAMAQVAAIPPGAPGPAGPRGPMGPAGPQGDAGSPGAPATVAIEGGPITGFPYIPSAVDAEGGQILLVPSAPATVSLPNRLHGATGPAGFRSWRNLVFLIEPDVAVTFVPAPGVTLRASGASAPLTSYVATGPLRAVVMQTSGSDWRLLR